MVREIQDVLQAHVEAWLAIPGVVGAAIGQLQGNPSITVLVAKKTDRIVAEIPLRVDGYPVVIKETGDIGALD